MTQHIRRAAPADAAAITGMIHGPADFEGAADPCSVTETPSLPPNNDAIAVYDVVGGQPQCQRISYRVSGPGLAELAAPR